MKKTIVVLFALLHIGCNAMDNARKLINKNGRVYYKKQVIVDSYDRVKLNNTTQHSVRGVLLYRNIIEKMSNKTDEKALRFLARLCLKRTHKLATIYGKKGLYFFYDKSNNELAQNVKILLKYNLIKKCYVSCYVPFIVDDIVQSQFEFNEKNMQINEPVKIFETLKKNFGANWQKELLKATKK